MIFEYPYTDMYRLNLDWMLKAIKEVQTIIEDLGSVVNTVNGMTGDVVLTRDILTEILGSVVHSVNGMSGDVTLTKAYLTTLLDGIVNTFNGRTGTVSLTAADVTNTMIDITWTSDPGDTINTLSQADLDELYAAGKRVLIFLNNLGSPDQIFFLTIVGSVVTPQPYTPTGAISGVASFNGLTGAVTVTAETLPLDDQSQDTIADELDDINDTLSSQSQQIVDLGPVNNVTSDSTTAALAAAQGKALQTSIDNEVTRATTAEGNEVTRATTAEGKLETLVINITSFSSLPQTYTAAQIPAVANVEDDMVVLQSVLGTPSAQTSDWTVTTDTGTLTISGSISGSTTLTLYLMKSR